MQMIRQRIINRLNLRVRQQRFIRPVGLGNPQLVRGVFRLPRIARSNGRHLAPSALLHSRDHFASGNRRHTQHSPFHLLPFHDPASLSLPTSIMPPWPVQPPSRFHLLRDPYCHSRPYATSSVTSGRLKLLLSL